MTTPFTPAAVRTLQEYAHPLDSSALDAIVERAGPCQYVLLGESTRGTREFHRLRAELTRRLVREKGFTAVVWDVDWPDAHRVNRYVKESRPRGEALRALGGFKRFPSWSWRNEETAAFVEWLRDHNEAHRDPARRAGIYGLDLYGFHQSRAAVIRHLDRLDPEAAERARFRFGCLDQEAEDREDCAYHAGYGLSAAAEGEIVQALVERQRRGSPPVAGGEFEDELFLAQQNARLLKQADAYYRALFAGRREAWNARAHHHMDTLNRLVGHLFRTGRLPKIVVWAHNAQVGDAAATERGERGWTSLGELARRQHGHNTLIVGLSTFRGTVTAAEQWGGPPRRMTLAPALADSYESLLHRTGIPSLCLDFSGSPRLRMAFRQSRRERSVGALYRALREEDLHYRISRLSDQYDFLLHVDETEALGAGGVAAGKERAHAV